MGFVFDIITLGMNKKLITYLLMYSFLKFIAQVSEDSHNALRICVWILWHIIFLWGAHGSFTSGYYHMFIIQTYPIFRSLVLGVTLGLNDLYNWSNVIWTQIVISTVIFYLFERKNKKIDHYVYLVYSKKSLSFKESLMGGKWLTPTKHWAIIVCKTKEIKSAVMIDVVGDFTKSLKPRFQRVDVHLLQKLYYGFYPIGMTTIKAVKRFQEAKIDEFRTCQSFTNLAADCLVQPLWTSRIEFFGRIEYILAIILPVIFYFIFNVYLGLDLISIDLAMFTLLLLDYDEQAHSSSLPQVMMWSEFFSTFCVFLLFQIFDVRLSVAIVHVVSFFISRILVSMFVPNFESLVKKNKKEEMKDTHDS